MKNLMVSARLGAELWWIESKFVSWIVFSSLWPEISTV